MIARFNPQYLAISVEINTYAQNCPTAWPDVKALLNIQCGSGPAPGLPSTGADQQWWIRRMLADVESYSMPFAVTWTDQDLAPATELTTCTCPDSSDVCNYLNAVGSAASGVRYFGLQGLRAADGTARPALADWTAAVAHTK